MAAFRHAVHLGYRYLETDLHATRDGYLVAFHDAVLDRVSDGQGPIAEQSLRKIQTVRVATTEHIPTLDELFETFPEIRFNLDLKSAAAIEPLAKTIDAHRAHDRVCVGSFSSERIRAFRKLMGRRVPTSVSPGGVTWNAYVPLLPRLLNSPGVAFQVPVTHRELGRDIRVLTKRLIRHAHGSGKVIQVWTIDEPQMMNDLIDAGVDGLITDRTDTLKEVLLDRGLWDA